jgi:CopG family nickel-responsive transcriptional regulator
MALSGDAKVKRFSVSLPPNLVEEFNETWRKMRYDNRSKAIHDAIRTFITEVQWMKQESGFVVGVVLVLYYLDKPKLVEEVTALQSRFKGIVVTIQQLYVEENKMLSVINVKGDVAEIKRLTQELMSMKGVKQVKASLIAP